MDQGNGGKTSTAMKIGQLVKMIREADPTGEAFVMDEEFSVPRFFEEKPGYYDGAYYYIDDQGRYVKEDTGHKVDVHDNTLTWLVWEYLEWELDKVKKQAVLDGGVYLPTREEAWDVLMNMVTYEDDVPIEFRNDINVRLEETFNEWIEHKKHSDVKWVDDTLKDVGKGYRFFQSKDKDTHGWTTWKMTKDPSLLGKTYDELRKLFGKKEREHCDGVCFGMIDALTTSGRFERVSYDEKWWQWISKEQ
jgi:hypothetical protein